MSKTDIYGKDPDGGADFLAKKALESVRVSQKPTEADNCASEGTSSSRDITENLGQAKP